MATFFTILLGAVVAALIFLTSDSHKAYVAKEHQLQNMKSKLNMANREIERYRNEYGDLP